MNTGVVIDWKNVAHALKFYAGAGFTYLEVPWVVSDEAVAVTMPKGRIARRTQDGPLVGSAEQSFIQMAMDGSLGLGRYVAATPCFRDDPPGPLHRSYFFKVELIEVVAREAWTDEKVLAMADTALAFFLTRTWGCKLAIVPTDSGVDIELSGVEIGSYGRRCTKINGSDFRWIFGTGYADPRFSIALDRCRI